MDLSGITDANGVSSIADTVLYRWQRFTADLLTLEGRVGTDATYTLTDADLGKLLKVTVLFTDDDGYVERTTNSAATAVVVQSLVISGVSMTDYAENWTSTVATYAVTGADANATTTWTLTGDDSDDFSISSAGALSFDSAPDYENATDGDSANVYEITVNASDGTNTGTLDVTITVTDVNEAPVRSGG